MNRLREARRRLLLLAIVPVYVALMVVCIILHGAEVRCNGVDLFPRPDDDR